MVVQTTPKLAGCCTSDCFRDPLPPYLRLGSHAAKSLYPGKPLAIEDLLGASYPLVSYSEGCVQPVVGGEEYKTSRMGNLIKVLWSGVALLSCRAARLCR